MMTPKKPPVKPPTAKAPATKPGGNGAPFRVADPSSGRQMRAGSPVPNAGPSKPTDYTKMKTVQPVARVTPKDVTGAMGGNRGVIEKSDVGRVKDPSGVPLRKGQPVQAPYSGSFNDKVDLGLKSAAKAVDMGMQPPKGRK